MAETGAAGVGGAVGVGAAGAAAAADSVVGGDGEEVEGFEVVERHREGWFPWTLAVPVREAAW